MSFYNDTKPSALPGASEHSLAGTVALITGAASGIGRASAFALLEHGASVAFVDISSDRLAETLSNVTTPGSAEAFICDLSDPAATAELVDDVVGRFGRLDILINAAGVWPHGTLLDSSVEMWDLTYRVNLLAPFLLMQAAARQMIRQGAGGRIVNLGSGSAHRPRAYAAYSASKAALAALTRVSANDLGSHGITVNTVVPGLTRTPGTSQSMPDDAAYKHAVTSGHLSNLLGRVNEAEDIAAMILFLCLPASRQITAQELHVSAGAIT